MFISKEDAVKILMLIDKLSILLDNSLILLYALAKKHNDELTQAKCEILIKKYNEAIDQEDELNSRTPEDI